ncbi:transcription termination factor mterf8, chloroplastic [Fagus crenata]
MFSFICKTILNGGKHTITVRAPPQIHKLGFLQNPSLSLKYISSTTNQQPFAASYFINTFGFSPQAALSASRYVNFEIPEKPDSVVNFLKNQGFSQTQISILVKRLPSVLKCNPEKTLLPKIEFFSSKGFSSPDLAKLLSVRPDLFKTSLEKQIIPAFDFLTNVLQSEANTIETIKRFSGMLKCDIETCVAPNVNILRESGVPESNIITLLKSQPRVFNVLPGRFREVVEEVKEMGFNPLRLSFALAVLVMRSMSKSTWEKKVDVYKKWGWSEDEILLAFGKYPWCMAVSEDKIMRIMDFYLNKMGMESSYINKCPQLVSLSLEKRLIPRGLVFQVLLSKGLVKNDGKMRTFFQYPEKSFLQKFVMPHKEEASELLTLYKGKLDLPK